MGCLVRCTVLRQRGLEKQGRFSLSHTYCDAKRKIKTWDGLTLIFSLTVSLRTQLHQDVACAVGSVPPTGNPVGAQYMLVGWTDG